MKFFELLQISTGSKVCFSQTPTADEWHSLFELAQKHALVGVSFYAIERLPLDQRPPKPLLMRWYSATELIKSRNKEIDANSITVCQRFAQAGFRSVVLKGQGIARLYPEPSYRMPGDIDIWVEGGRDKVIGYIRTIKPDSVIFYHHADFLSIGHTEIEVHFTPSWMNNYFTNKKLQTFFAQHSDECFAQGNLLLHSPTTIPVPTPAFNRVFILVHIYRHLFSEGIGLRQLLDYYYVLRQGFTDEERNLTVNELTNLGMRSFTASVMYVLQYVFGLSDKYLLVTADETEGRFLLEEIMQPGNFGHHDQRIIRHQDESELHIFFRRVIRNFRFITTCPSESLCSPLFKLWHYFMRCKWNRVNTKNKSMSNWY